jgi:hypothetical protein
MLGEARSKFGTINGPQGGTTLNGETLKQEGMAMIEKLDQEILLNMEGGNATSFIIG